MVSDDGTTLRARKAYERGEFIASTDERFRPVYLSTAPDGTLYVVDMYRGIIQHRGYITEYLRDQILSRKLEQPIGLGRIWRVVHDTTRRDARPALSALSAGALVEALSHPNGWWRDTAQRLLVERRRVAAERSSPALASWPTARRTGARALHALWTLDGMDRDRAGDGDAGARGSVARRARVGGPHRGAVARRGEPADAGRRSLQRIDDADWAVRAQLAASLGALPPGTRETSSCRCSSVTADDPSSLDAALSGLRGGEAACSSRSC